MDPLVKIAEIKDVIEAAGCPRIDRCVIKSTNLATQPCSQIQFHTARGETVAVLHYDEILGENTIDFPQPTLVSVLKKMGVTEIVAVRDDGLWIAVIMGGFKVNLNVRMLGYIDAGDLSAGFREES